MPIENSKEVMFYQSIDKFLKHIEHKEGYYSQFINTNNLAGRNALKLMKEYRMVYFRSEDMPIDSPVEITDIGKEVLRVGGAKRYVDSRKVVEYQTDQLQFEKLEYDVKNSKRIYKTYWFTFTIACLGFLLALYNFLKPILKLYLNK